MKGATPIPDPSRIRSFTKQADFEAWLAAHRAGERELWLRLYKKGSGVPTVTYAEALDVALCWGWIDGLKKSWGDASFLLALHATRPQEPVESHQPRPRHAARR